MRDSEDGEYPELASEAGRGASAKCRERTCRGTRLRNSPRAAPECF